jgi:hypothetical protein
MSQLYLQAATVVQLWLDRKGGLKTLAFAENVRQKAAVYSLSAETLKFKLVLDDLLIETGLRKAADAQNVRTSLLLVMVYELLFGHGTIISLCSCGRPLERVWCPPGTTRSHHIPSIHLSLLLLQQAKSMAVVQ